MIRMKLRNYLAGTATSPSAFNKTPEGGVANRLNILTKRAKHKLV